MGALKYIFLVFLLAGNFALGQESEEMILWSPEVKLTWLDFKAKPPSVTRAAATTASGISYQFSTIYEGNVMQVDFTVEAHFYPDKSWYKKELCDDVILSHEQLHFDISELFARKMRAQLSSTKFTSNIKREIQKIYKTTLQELNDFQNTYDNETNFSRNLEAQLRWNVKIKKELAK